jgi:hypothetical protein
LKLFNYFWLKFVKVDIENPVALHFIMQDDLFFLNEDRQAYSAVVKVAAVAVEESVAAVKTTSENIVAEPVLAPKAVRFNFMGKKGGMLILVHYPALEFIHDAHLTALENILKRKEIAIGDVAILNMAKHSEVGFDDVMKYFGAKKILLLGKQSWPVGIAPLQLNIPQQLTNGSVLFSFSFDEMMDSPDNKKAFWEQMKNF